MADQPQAPVLISPIPALALPEEAAFTPIDLKEYVRSPNEISGSLRFSALLADGRSLPIGLDCSDEGVISGTASKGTAGEYNVTLTIENDSDIPLIVWVKLSIQAQVVPEEASTPQPVEEAPQAEPEPQETPPIEEPLSAEDKAFIPNLKSQVWKALGENAPVPEMEHLLSRPLSAVEIYYLLQRFAVLTIWDVYNLEVPGDKIALNLPENSPYYNIYDRGSCLVAAPKDLYTHKRTIEDALKAARAMANEVYKRGWTIEFAGFSKMARAAWIELQLLGDKHGKAIEILHYKPSSEDLKIYSAKLYTEGPSPG
jgi:hypothetical protein